MHYLQPSSFHELYEVHFYQDYHRHTLYVMDKFMFIAVCRHIIIHGANIGNLINCVGHFLVLQRPASFLQLSGICDAICSPC